MVADNVPDASAAGKNLDSTDFRQTWRMQAHQRGAQKACLTAMNGALLGRTYHLGAGRLIVGRGDDCDLVLNDDGVSRRHALLVKSSDGRVAVEDLHSTNGTAVNGRRCSERQLHGGERLQFGSASIFKFEFRDAIDEEFATNLYESATRDRLTGVFNQRHLCEQLPSEFSWHRRHDTPLSLIFIDIDFFKAINDVHGHLGGDDILRQVTQRIQAQTRDEDILARYGGEEFACLLRRTPLAAATIMAERMRRAVAATPMKLRGPRGSHSVPVTISAGVAQSSSAMGSFEQLIANADHRLYEAKAGGRDRVVPALFNKS